MASKSDQVRSLLAKGMSAGDISKKVGCSRNLVYVIKSNDKIGGSKASKRGAPKKRGRPPGRPRASAATSGVDDLISRVRTLESEHAECRRVLEKIRALVS